MTIVEINTSNFGSTGCISLGIAEVARQNGYKVYTACANSRSNKRKHVKDQILIGNRISRNLHYLLAYITGMNGCFSCFSTINLLRKIKKLSPDMFHLHNLHGSYINIPLLFRFIKKHNIPVIWTLHDCWSVTGQCPHFTIVKCEKWNTGCHHCAQYRSYPATCFDQTKIMHKLKKKWFTGVDEMTIVTPSQWLADIVKRSYLKDYPVQVINNGIDLSVFHPVQSDFRQRYNCTGKFIILGVAFGWNEKKGLDVFVELAKRLDAYFQIVLVGTDENVDRQLPANIISIHRTHNQKELAEIYTAADLFVNPTREENYPTVNMESIACGTPVLTFNTGGSPEIPNDMCGCVVDCDDIDAMEREIRRIAEKNLFSEEACLERSKMFDMNDRFEEYTILYSKKDKKNV